MKSRCFSTGGQGFIQACLLMSVFEKIEFSNIVFHKKRSQKLSYNEGGGSGGKGPSLFTSGG